jgi:hypothetical protein
MICPVKNTIAQSRWCQRIKRTPQNVEAPFRKIMGAFDIYIEVWRKGMAMHCQGYA